MNSVKRFFAFFLAVLMLGSVIPLASAADYAPELEKDAEGYYLINTLEEADSLLYTVMHTGGDNYVKLRLNKDIIESDNENNRMLYVVGNGMNVQFDLNGHTLSRKCRSFDYCLFNVLNGGTLDVYDTSEEQTGTLYFENNAYGDSTSRVFNVERASLYIYNGNFKIGARGEIIYVDAANVTIYGGNFEATGYAAEGIRIDTNDDLHPAPRVIIYNAAFHTQSIPVEITNKSKLKQGDGYPYVVIFDGEYYSDNDYGFCDILYRGMVLVISGLVRKGGEQSYLKGKVLSEETIDGQKYVRVSPPIWLQSKDGYLDRYTDIAERVYLLNLPKKSAIYKQNSEYIDRYLSLPPIGTVGAYDINALQFQVNVPRKDVKQMRFYVSSASPDDENWQNGPWSLFDTKVNPGDVAIFTIARPKEETCRFYRLNVVFDDGSEYDDYVMLYFEEPIYILSGTAFPTMGNVRYGATLFCGLKDLPSYIPVDSLSYEWYINDTLLVGNERTFNISEDWMIGKYLTVKVKSSFAEGTIVSEPVLVKPAANNETPDMPLVSISMSGDKLSSVTLDPIYNTQQYLITKKKQSELTEDDWKLAYKKPKDTFGNTISFTRSQLSDQFGITVNTGDTVYVHTRYAEAKPHAAGSVVLTVPFKVGQSVSLNAITFPTAENGCVLIPYDGTEKTVEIPYSFDPVNATTGSDIYWRISSSASVTVISPTEIEHVASASGKITVKITGAGAANITAYYKTYMDNDYGKVSIVVYDPNNVTASDLMIKTPLEDAAVYARDGYSCALPEFAVAPTEAIEYKWFFTRGTMYGYERLTDVGFAVIDTATGEIDTNAAGKVSVSLFANDNLIDGYELTVLEKPDNFVALDGIFPDSDNITMKIGESRKIKIYKSPVNATEDQFKFVSSNPKIAFVNADGVVYAYKAGETTITVTDIANKVSTTVKVTVSDILFSSFTPGDVNGDGNVDNKDVVTLFRYLSGANVTVNTVALDINGDGSVDNKDVVVLFRYLSGADVTIYG